MQDLKRVSNTAQLSNKSDQVARSWSCAAIRLGLSRPILQAARNPTKIKELTTMLCYKYKLMRLV